MFLEITKTEAIRYWNEGYVVQEKIDTDSWSNEHEWVACTKAPEGNDYGHKNWRIVLAPVMRNK